MTLSKRVTEVIRQRYSCRRYLETPIDVETRDRLAHFMAANQTGPFGSPTRFELVAAKAADREALRGLGTLTMSYLQHRLVS